MIITAESHLDHGLTEAQVAHILSVYGTREGFFIETFELPEALGSVPCGLHGPVTGDAAVGEGEVSYETRGDRGWPSRVCERPERGTREVTLIAGPHGDATVLYTAFGGPLAPKEPGDPSIPADKEKESRDFWAAHALTRP